jgi:hypothetical protein
MVSLSSMQTTAGAKASVVRDTARVERPEVHAPKKNTRSPSSERAAEVQRLSSGMA